MIFLKNHHKKMRKTGEADGLQDLPRAQLLTGLDGLCKGLRSPEEAQVCQRLQRQGRTVQVLHQEGRRLLPRVQVYRVQIRSGFW